MTKLNKHISFSDRHKSIVDWYIEYFVEPEIAIQSKLAWNEFSERVDGIFKTRGSRNGLAWVKCARLHYTKFIAGQPLLDQSLVEINSVGLPKSLKHLNKLCIIGSTKHLRVLLTILTVTRVFRLPPLPDYKSITDAWCGAIPENWNLYKPTIMRTLAIGKAKCEFKRYHVSAKSGPNGQAIMSSMMDIEALDKDEPLLESIKVMGGNKLRENLDLLTDWANYPRHYDTLGNCTYIWNVENLCTRRLACLSDVEGKTRIIAIMDYWSQTALLPLHKYINKILAKIPEDCTFDQGSFIAKLPKVGPYYSFDLTNATDRLPLEFQKQIISHIIGEDKVDHWSRIMVGSPFHTKAGPVTYETGQPMGAYSSWPSMAITHHAIVWLAAKSVKKSARGKYVLLGDDIVIADKDIADQYTEIMKTLDVPISKPKTFISLDTYEFAKRIVHRGSEITPFPIPAICETWKRYYLLHDSFMIAKNRGYSMDSAKVHDSLTSIVRRLGKPGQAPRILKLFTIFNLLSTKVTYDGDRYCDLYKYISENWKPVKGNKPMNVTQENFKSIILKASKQMVEAEIRGTSYECVDMVKRMEGWEIYEWKEKNKSSSDYSNVSFATCKHLHPIVDVASQIINRRSKYVDQINDCIDRDAPFEELSKLLLELPVLGVKTLNTRNHHRILAAHARFVKLAIAIVRENRNLVERRFNIWLDDDE